MTPAQCELNRDYSIPMANLLAIQIVGYDSRTNERENPISATESYRDEAESCEHSTHTLR
jgi:hypothetical protein